MKLLFDPHVNGRLPDVVLEGTTIEDWQAVLDLVRSRGWAYAYELDDEPMELPSAAEMAAAHAATRVTPHLKVWPVPEVLLIFWMYDTSSIDFDADLRELQGQERLDVLTDVLCGIGRRLGKSVLMSAEGSRHPDLGFDVEADRVVPMVDLVELNSGASRP